MEQTRAYDKKSGRVWVWDAVQDEWRPETGAEGTARNTSPFMAGLAAAGDVLTRGGRAMTGLFGDVTGQDEMAQGARDRAAEDAPIMGALSQAHPVATRIGEALPSLSGGVIGMGTRALAGQLIEQAAVAGIAGGLADPNDMLTGAGMGLATGFGGVLGGRMAGRVVSGVRAAGASIRGARQAAAADAAAAMEAGGAGGGARTPAGGAPPGAPPGGGGLGGIMDAGLPGATAPMEHARLVGEADRLGIVLEPGARLQSTPVRQVDVMLKRSPFTSGAFESIVQKPNQRVYNRLAASALGEDAGAELSAGTLSRAATRIGEDMKQFGKLAGHVPVGTDATLLAESNAIIERASTGSTKTPRVVDAMQGLRELQNDAGTITGDRLMSERSRLVRDMKRFSKAGDSVNVEGLSEVVDWIDLSMARGIQQKLAAKGQQLSGGTAEEALKGYEKARGQWSVLRTLENRGTTVGGDVRPVQLAENMRQHLGSKWTRGNTIGQLRGKEWGDLVSGLKIASNFRDIVGDSGTATALGGAGMTSSPTAAGLLLGAGRALTAGPLARAWLKTGGSPGMAGGLGGLLTPDKGNIATGGLLGATISRAVGGML